MTYKFSDLLLETTLKTFYVILIAELTDLNLKSTTSNLKTE